jgi:hypothetical protein
MKDISQAKLTFFLASVLLLDDSACTIPTELWWSNQETRWWPQFRNVVSPHRHHHPGICTEGLSKTTKTFSQDT